MARLLVVAAERAFVRRSFVPVLLGGLSLRLLKIGLELLPSGALIKVAGVRLMDWTPPLLSISGLVWIAKSSVS